jgi:threonine aldolase
MNFASDNVMGASQPVLEALVRANAGALTAYGGDEITRRVEARFAEVFEREVAVLLVATGTAANALALAALVPPYGVCVCHREAHVMEDECGAPEFFTHGAKLVGLDGEGAKIAVRDFDAYLGGLRRHVKQMPPKALSLSQASECGLVYTPDEIAALSAICRRHGVKLHMDGARFANALVRLGCTPAEMTWKAGVDILSFGGTKNGCIGAEALVFFDPARAKDAPYLRKRAGQLFSKSRFIAAQFAAYFHDGLWLELARHSNGLADRLRAGLAAAPHAREGWPTHGNEVFAVLRRADAERLRRAGAFFHDWAEPHSAELGLAADEVLVRLVTAFATRPEDVEAFLRELGA